MSTNDIQLILSRLDRIDELQERIEDKLERVEDKLESHVEKDREYKEKQADSWISLLSTVLKWALPFFLAAGITFNSKGKPVETQSWNALASSTIVYSKKLDSVVKELEGK